MTFTFTFTDNKFRENIFANSFSLKSLRFSGGILSFLTNFRKNLAFSYSKFFSRNVLISYFVFLRNRLKRNFAKKRKLWEPSDCGIWTHIDFFYVFTAEQISEKTFLKSLFKWNSSVCNSVFCSLFVYY